VNYEFGTSGTVENSSQTSRPVKKAAPCCCK
jgi:hypothetical protein